jgi:hypothetical protein
LSCSEVEDGTRGLKARRAYCEDSYIVECTWSEVEDRYSSLRPLGLPHCKCW